MNKKSVYLFVVLAVGLFLISACQQEINECEKFSKNFDANIGSMSASKCDKWKEEGEKQIIVGGKLIDISKVSVPFYQRNEFTLTFQGFEKTGSISIGTEQDTIPYEMGKFYRFNYGKQCSLIYSMASSGMFSDPKLNALENVPECN